ncbi:MAG: S41 family peptidase, partial [Candidatus Micrarchaeaceae archaeon]
MIFSGKHMYGYCLATALILPVTAVASGLTIPGSTPAPDSSSSQREEIARTVVRLAQQYHYPAETLNGNFSKRMLLEYVDTLDPQHSYFTRKDIDNLNKEFGDALPTDLEAGKLGPAFSIYALYDTRVHQRIDYALKQLSGKPDFKGKEVYRYKRSHAPFPTDRKALDLLWGKQVKNDAITIMLAAHTWDDTARILKNRYNSLLSNTIHASKNKILTLYLNSYMQTLDPHSAYFSNFQAERFDSRISLRSGGIGARLNFRNGYITLEHIFPGGAAAKTRVLKPGDRIVGIGQGQTGTILNIVGWNPDTVNKMTRGRVGTKIRLLVLPTGESAEAKKITVTLVRTNIGLDGERAEARILSSQIGPFAYSIGVIRIPSFYSNLQSSGHNIPKVANDVSYLVRQLRNRNVSAILLDLRYNNGGSLKQALALAGLFIPQGPVVQIENHYGKIQVLDTPADSVPIWRGPLGILVNRFSASATEIFTEAMKTYNRAVIFGSRTWGKGTIQTLIPLHKYLPRLKAGEIKLTVAQYFGVNGSGIQLHGIQPDINIPTHTDLK